MVDINTLRSFALSLPDTSEQPHFEKTSFRTGKKIFATYDEKTNQACIKLSEIDQDVFSSFNRSVIFPVPNKWGKQGWTIIDMNRIPPELFEDALETAYHQVSGK